jgi:hypothetical protein
MARLLQILGVLCGVTVLAVWLILGAHTGWTKTQTSTRHVDPVTEIEYDEFKPGFVPGVDFLAVGLAGSGLLFLLGFGISKLQRKKNTPT